MKDENEPVTNPLPVEPPADLTKAPVATAAGGGGSGGGDDGDPRGGNGGDNGGGSNEGGKRLRDLSKKIPLRGCIILVIIVLALLLGYGIYEAGRLGAARDQSGNKPDAAQQVASTHPQTANAVPSSASVNRENTSVLPLVACLACALVASFLLAVLLSINQQPPWKRHEVLSIAGVLTILSGALMFGTWQLSEAEPNKALFLVAANFLALSLFVLSLCYIPKAVRAMQGVTSPFIRFTVVLSLAGAAGGLGYHLVNHDGGLIIPELTKFEDVVRTAITKPAIASATTSPSPGPSPAGATKTVIRPSFNIGFLGDIFLGIIAANALHLAMANLLDYANSKPQPKQYFTLLALGILGGFAGASALTSWSNKFLNPAEVAAIVKSEVEQRTGTNNAPAAPIPDAGEVSQKVIEALTRLQWPDESTLAQMGKFVQAVTASNKPVEKLSPDELLAAAGSNFFTKQVGSFTADKYLTALFNQTTAPPNLRWGGRMLRVVSATDDGTPLVGKGWYDAVLDDLAQFANSSATEEQYRARVLVSDFALFAAVIDGSAKIPNLDALASDLNWAANTESQSIKEAAGLAKAIAAYFKGNSTPDKNAIPVDPARLLRIATAMRALPKQFLEALALLENKKLEPVLRPFVEKAPRYQEK